MLQNVNHGKGEKGPCPYHLPSAAFVEYVVLTGAMQCGSSKTQMAAKS